ncbi:MAG TPA: glycosyltransferase family 39 protein, partial [Solirubrobacteraceae bacterium]|nr:glycosyltransferase family 39 protein [Solirubrobacteraceae bacterium]
MGATSLHRDRPSLKQSGALQPRLNLPAPPGWAFPAALCLLTALGFAIRAANITQGLYGDELSTAWIVHGRGLGRVISLVYSDAEVTPPLSFVLAWISLKIGSSWAWLRLPSLLAGTATIPIVYGIGARTSGRTAGLTAAAITALSAVMIMFSTEARNYAVMMAAVAGSTLSMLLALDTGRVRWWVLYAFCSCVAMYSHYTAAFVLIVQAVWLLWRHPQARRAVILANLGAAAVYAPWIPGWIKDTHSVTIPIINVLAPFNFGAVRTAVAHWAIGYPYLGIHQSPGVTFAVLIC